MSRFPNLLLGSSGKKALQADKWWRVQLHATGGASTCGLDGQLLLSSEDLRDIFVAATAELPGLLLSAAIMDVFGRKWCAHPRPGRVTAVHETPIVAHLGPSGHLSVLEVAVAGACR